MRTQGLLANSGQLDNDKGGIQRQPAQGRLPNTARLLRETAPTLVNRRMPNGTYGGVRGRETKVGQKTFVSRPTRLVVQPGLEPRLADPESDVLPLHHWTMPCFLVGNSLHKVAVLFSKAGAKVLHFSDIPNFFLQLFSHALICSEIFFSPMPSTNI